MSRKVRRVPPSWQHPVDQEGKYKPLFDSDMFAYRLQDYVEEIEQYGLEAANQDFGEGGPSKIDYMPDWPEQQKTHLMMYETTTEGTPVSPAFEKPQDLAKWLVDNNVPVFANMMATYEQWMDIIMNSAGPMLLPESGKMGLACDVPPTPGPGGGR